MTKLFALLALSLMSGASAQNAMATTVQLINELENEVTKDGKAEQASFDQYACWCEKTMERKAADIAHSKDTIAEMLVLIKKLKGEIASHGAEIDQLQKDIAQNGAAVKEAEDLRNKENSEYMGERIESEQCIGAMEAAIKVLTGAGTKSFLQGSMHEAELLSVVAGVRTALGHKASKLSGADIELMKHFVSKPEDFVAKKSTGMSAAQVGQNPFGDYAPQSSQIQGILKGMYDAFTSDLEKDNVNEADAQKSFEEIFATKMKELNTLKETLQMQETNSAEKNKRLAESETLLGDSQDNLEADSTFFEDTKAACQAKATEWSVRTRLRTEELNGMQTAIRILSSKSATKTFDDSVTNNANSKPTKFLQLKAVQEHQESASKRANAFMKLKNVAAKYQNRNVARIALQLKAGGHFDKVIAMIDDMMVLLRKEEADDIAHRDRCEDSENANGNEMADLKGNIQKTKQSLKRMGEEKKDLEGQIKDLEGEIKATNGDMAELLKFRNQEVAEFRENLKDDTDAVGLLKQAMAALSKYYENNKIDLPQFVQKSPEYAQDADKAPETNFAANDSRKSETGGIMAIMEMLVEDVQKEIKEGRADDADAEAKYDKQESALQATLDEENEMKANTEKDLADLESKMSSYEDHQDSKEADLGAEKDSEKAINTDCSWVKTHFQTRRDKRKDEMDGLVDAKASLAAAGTGTYLD